MSSYKPIAESKNFIVLEDYKKNMHLKETEAVYQAEPELENKFIRDLVGQGYEYLKDVTTNVAMLDNVRSELQRLNNIMFNDMEWYRFCEEYLDKSSDNHVDKTKKIHNDYIYDFTFDDGRIENVYLLNKSDISKNKLQVISQFEQTGKHANRYDVTILVNGLPLIHVELKKRGVSIREAFNQIHRYSKESFNSDSSLYKYLQIFVISNGTDSRYFANTTTRDQNSFDYTMNWATSKNVLIRDIDDFTKTFFQKNTILKLLIEYCVFNSKNQLMIMRPYQIAATERILWKIKSSFEANKWNTIESGGYIWHTTGSGKTLTSFKTAQLATELEFIDKVLFVVDRKDLDYQTMKEYQSFSKDSVNGSQNTAGLKKNLENDDNKIIVTTIQKLNILIKSEDKLPVYDKQVVFIFDEAHRSQFGETQKNIKKKFKKYYQFGFTGTPIFVENAVGSETTASVFGRELHSYVITDAIRDDKVLKFKVDYNDVRPKFKALEMEQDEKKLNALETKKALLHPERIREISTYILKNFKNKTHRLHLGVNGFNAMFAVSSVDAAKLYYETLNNLQNDQEHKIKIATIFSFSANEEQTAIGEITDESFELSALDSSAKEFLSKAINEYNEMFSTNFGVESKEFQNYYRDLSMRVKNQEVDLLIVVGMFLTGFDAPTLNTLFVDKNLRYHGLIQAFSRTNRIYNSRKSFGNIVCFRNLEQATIDAITLFGDKNTKNVILEKSYKEYLEGFNDQETGEARNGLIEIVNKLNTHFSDIDEITTETEKKEFVKVFGEYLKIQNVLQNYDEFVALKIFQTIDLEDEISIKKFKEIHNVSNEDFEIMHNIPVLSERKIQDYRSTYNDIREWIRREKEENKNQESMVDWDEVVFEVELLKSQEINLDYILELILEKAKKFNNKELLVDEMRRIIRSSLGNRAKEGLIIDFIGKTDLKDIPDKASIIEMFFKFAQKEQQIEAYKIITEENLNEEAAKRYIQFSLKREFASENGTEINEILPKMSPLNPNYLTKKQSVFKKISNFVNKFKGVGGKI
ncbi:MAG: type I restriction endonuclease subunit R [Mycoplasmatales bacterium]